MHPVNRKTLNDVHCSICRAHNQKWGYHDGFVHVLADPRLVLDIRVSFIIFCQHSLWHACRNEYASLCREASAKRVLLSFSMSASFKVMLTSNGVSNLLETLVANKETLVNTYHSKISETIHLPLVTRTLATPTLPLAQKTFMKLIVRSIRKRRLIYLMNSLLVQLHLR